MEATYRRQKFQDYKTHLRKLEKAKPSVDSGLQHFRNLLRPNPLAGNTSKSKSFTRGLSKDSRNQTADGYHSQHSTFLTAAGVAHNMTGIESYHRTELKKSKEILKNNTVRLR